MITGWYRDLYETQHGKHEDKSEAERLISELASMKHELATLKEENSQLRVSANKLKLGESRRRVFAEFPPQLNLARHVSDTLVHGGGDENTPPAVLDLNRAQTTPNW